MPKRLFLFLLFLFAFRSIYAQPIVAAKPGLRHVRISLVTVGPGDRIWETFGHSCVRVIDSSREGKARDLIFNYGTFDNFDQNFAGKLMNGTLLYYLSVFPYDFFVNVYVEKGRSIEEQVLLLNDTQRTNLVNNLELNTLPANKYYQYDFFTDNCCTRIHNMITRTLGNTFVPGKAIPAGSPISFYEGSYQYCKNTHWARVAIAIFFEHRMNKDVTDADVMFLPAYLSRAFDGAALNGRKACAPVITYAADTRSEDSPPNGPLIFTAIIAILTITGTVWPRAALLGRVMSFFVLLLSGLLGCAILYAWLGTSHSGSQYNLDLLWALPFNLIIPFLPGSVKAKYALAGIALIMLCMVFYVLRIMVMPLPELTPFLLSLVWVYAAMYRYHTTVRSS